MQQTRLIQILNRFDKTEARQFGLFLESPLFNTSEKLLSFYKLLIQHHPDFESASLSKERIYQKLHGRSEYTDQTMRALTSSLLKLVMEFIPLCQLKKKQTEARHLKYEWLNERGLTKICEQELADCDEMLSKYVLRDYDYYLQRWLADYSEFSHQTEIARDVEHKLLKKKDIDHHIHSLNKYYLVRFLESYIYMLSLSKIYNTPADLEGGAHLDMMAAGYTGRGEQLIDSLYNIYQLLKSNDERFYYELKSIFLANDASLAFEMKTELSINLENFCIQKMINGDERFVSEILEIYRFTIEHGFMIHHGEMPYMFYYNVVAVGVNSLEIEWVKDFMETYRSKLPLQYRDGVYNYCRACIAFACGRYDEALRIAMEIVPFNDLIKVNVKNITARIQYELGMFEQLDILLDSYPYHLNRETITSSRKRNDSLFAGAMKQIIDLNRQYSISAWHKLWAQLSQAPVFTHKIWIMEKMTEMKARHESRQNHAPLPSARD